MGALSTLGISLWRHPHPSPPPQAGEGAHLPCGGNRASSSRYRSHRRCARDDGCGCATCAAARRHEMLGSLAQEYRGSER
ncbi:hypothetical protein EAS62_32660 [Bradyrhizobium zhanjiangense]|uniref:Uncharacterized protein n=1 Tax=Bradyrhizobium zhanjiangense TaxID=1325107 RepID=A0ABY0DDQ1_9BRAD|nr:hypothetical protein EAS62_32660 [Bradyrhizobium zhanjiangense]